MDDLQYGSRNKRGEWSPNQHSDVAPFWHWPISPKAVLKWLPHFFWPYQAFFMATTLLYWFFVLPEVEVLKNLHWGWILWIHAANCVGIFLFYGAIEFFYYVKRKQGVRFRYDPKFPADHPSEVFWFKSQNWDNFLRTFLLCIPTWTFCEVVFLWLFANGYVPWLTWADNGWYLAFLILMCPFIHSINFDLTHRLLHWGPLYKYVHSVHHNSVNPSPWSSLSMHPVEGLLYHGASLWHLLLPSAPFVALYQLHMAGFGAIQGHIGFEKLELTENATVDSHAYEHYLHHKYFDVNFSGGLVPFDKWFGTWHDGSKEAEAVMKERFKRKKERLKAKQARREERQRLKATRSGR